MMNVKIETPVEIIFPIPNVSDFGLELVHDQNGLDRNYLHQVDFQENNHDARMHAINAGYEYSHGFTADNGSIKYSVWQKQYPLSVAKWF